MLNRFLSSKTGTTNRKNEDAKLNLTVSAQRPTSSPTMADFTAPTAHASPKNLLSADVEIKGSIKKFTKALIGGTLGGLLGGILSWALKEAFNHLIENKDANSLLAPTSWGFVALGACIGLLVGLAQVILKDAWIKIEKGRRAGKEMFLSRERTQIGRAESCDIGLFGDNQIEKLHASILLVGNRYYVVDRQSPAGTYINEELAVGMVPLKSGDRIRVGGSVLRFRERARRD